MVSAWMVRAGENGEREEDALAGGYAGAGWAEIGDLAVAADRESVRDLVASAYPEASAALVANWTGQLWRFSHQILPGDIVVTPLKTKVGYVALGRVISPYEFISNAEPKRRHRVGVNWIRHVARSSIGGDLLDSLGALLTVCQISRHDAASRIERIAEGGDDPGWHPEGAATGAIEDRDSILTRALDEDISEPLKLSIRRLMSLWDYSRRTDRTIREVTTSLADSGLTTRPDISQGWLDSVVEIVRLPATPEQADAEGTDDLISRDRNSRVSVGIKTLEAATGGVVHILPEDTVTKAVSLMLRYDFSQLPVLGSGDYLLGVVSWESIGKANLSRAVHLVKEAMTGARTVDLDDDLLSVVGEVVRNDYVFVTQAGSSAPIGIVTVADLSVQFDIMSRPFTLIEEIERRLRRRVDETISVEHMRNVARRPRLVGASGLTLGNYPYLMENEDDFNLLVWSLDHDLFLFWVTEVSKIRNELMHFSTDPLDPSKLGLLEKFVQLLRIIDPRP